MRLGKRMQRDLERDLQEHIDIDVRDHIDRGMAPEEARRQALIKFGNPTRIAEDTRDVWRWMWLDRLRQDLRYTVRSLLRNPLFSAVAILTLALGIGLNTAVFSVVSAVLIKPLPYPGSDRLVWLAFGNKRFKFESSTAPDFHDWSTQTRSFEEMAGYFTVDKTVQDGEQSAKHAFVYITPAFWRLAGVKPALGRLFTSEDRDSIVLTWKMFDQRFNRDPRALGRVIRIDGAPSTIIGVLPREFHFLPPSPAAGSMTGEAEAFGPNIITPQLQARGPALLIMFVIARLKPGASIESAKAELQTLQSRAAREHAAMRNFYQNAEVRVLPLQEKLVGETRHALLVLLTAVGFVFLIACANLGNLLLARATARQREVAIRASIGAGRGRLVRHFMVEGLTLALIGGALGVVVASIANRLLIRLSPSSVPRLSELGIDWRVLLFALTASLLAGLVFGLAPLLSVSTDAPYSVLKEGGRNASAGSAGLRLRRIFVAAELALALVLLTGAGLMVKSFIRMHAHPPSFEPEKIGTMRVFLSGPGYREKGPSLDYANRLIEAVSHVPGVQQTAITNGAGTGVVDVEGPPRFREGEAPQTAFRTGSSDYPKLVGIPLLRGRWLRDDEPAPAVLVNESFVRRVFGNEDPLRKRVRDHGVWFTIVGVVGDMKVSQLDAPRVRKSSCR